MSVPGVNVITAARSWLRSATSVASARRVGRSATSVSTRVRQSGSGPASHGRISKRGSAPARSALVEASWSVVRQPGPAARLLRADPGPPRPPDRGRRLGAQARRALLAPADQAGGLRLCAALAHQEEAAPARAPGGAPKGKVKPGIWAADAAMRQAERELAEQAERAYQRSVADWQAKTPTRKGASAHRDAHLQRPASGKRRGRASVPDPAL
jgi:transposase